MKRKTIVILVVLVVFFGGIVSCGLLSALAIPAFTNYTLRAKTAEARTNLAMLAQRAEAYCQQTSTLAPAVGPTPAVPGTDRQQATWDGTWATLGFAPAQPVYYAYSIVPMDGGTWLELRAEGDLDGDGRRSFFSVPCAPAADGCACRGTAVYISDELE
jgi:Tfp pilus assembly protein PilE